MSETAGNVAEIRRKAQKALRLAWICAAAAVLLAVVLLVRTTDYMFVFFMFVGPPLLVVAAAALGWIIFQDLRHKKVL